MHVLTRQRFCSGRYEALNQKIIELQAFADADMDTATLNELFLSIPSHERAHALGET